MSPIQRRLHEAAGVLDADGDEHGVSSVLREAIHELSLQMERADYAWRNTRAIDVARMEVEKERNKLRTDIETLRNLSSRSPTTAVVETVESHCASRGDKGSEGMMMKKPNEMPFGEFAAAVGLSGAVNRLPELGAERLSYSVYLGGRVGAALPLSAQEQEYPAARVQAVTTKIGLDSESARDNLMTAELIAVREAWLAAVLEAATVRREVLSDAVVADYEALKDGFDHPWIAEQIDVQTALNGALAPALRAASEAVGRSVTDQIPDELGRGVIVAQDAAFTMQATDKGVVTHENRRLASVPAVGQDVTVLYYKGSGQVFDHSQNLSVSAPFIDPTTGDLAVQLLDDKEHVQQQVLFNGMATFAKFVEQQGLERSLVTAAMDVRAAAPKQPGKLNGIPIATAGRHIGPIVAVKDGVAVQDVGLGKPVGHEVSKFPAPPAIGKKMDITYADRLMKTAEVLSQDGASVSVSVNTR